MKQTLFIPTILVLVASVGIIAYTFLSSSFTFKDQLFYLLYPKKTSQAQEPLSVTIARPLEGDILPGNTTAYITLSTPENIKVSRLEIFIDDLAHCTVTSYPYTCRWKIPIGNGNRHIILAKVFDYSGRDASDTVTVTVR